MKKSGVLVFTGIVFLVFLSSCRHNPDIPSDPKHQASFLYDVSSTISANCTQAGCHAASSGGDDHVKSLVGYDAVMRYVHPGDARNSKLYEVISNHTTDHQMPPDHPLTDDQVKFIYLWIEQGALNN